MMLLTSTIPVSATDDDGCCQRPELTDVASSTLVLAYGHTDARENLALGNAQSDGQKNVCPQQQDNHRPAPQKVAEPYEYLVNSIHSLPFCVKQHQVS